MEGIGVDLAKPTGVDGLINLHQVPGKIATEVGALGAIER
jgi:hypothetical protein